MPQKRKPRGRRRQITIYRKTGQSDGKATSKEKSLVDRQVVFSIGTTLPTLAEMLLIK